MVSNFFPRELLFEYLWLRSHAIEPESLVHELNGLLPLAATTEPRQEAAILEDAE